MAETEGKSDDEISLALASFYTSRTNLSLSSGLTGQLSFEHFLSENVHKVKMFFLSANKKNNGKPQNFEPLLHKVYFCILLWF
jgi:hypothetical protein